MRRLTRNLTVLTVLAIAAPLAADDKVNGPLDFTVKDIKGKDVKLSEYQGKVVLLVNVASQCGLTPQYEGLEALYREFKDDGLVIIGVPANEFGKQEPGTDAEILEFCKGEYDVTFPMMSKVVVKGDGQVPLYKWLTSKETNPDFAGPIAWNFTKFLIGRDGQIAARFEPRVNPKSEEVVGAVKKEIEKQ